MKKWLMICFAALLLVGCSDKTSKEDTSQPDKQGETKSAKESKEESKKEEENTKYIEGLGNGTAVGIGLNDEVKLDGTDSPGKPVALGPMNLWINGLNIVDVELDEDEKAMFEGKEKIRAIIVSMKSENTSDSDITFYPNNSIITTDTGEQLESESLLMGETGGEFYGKVTKEGETWWIAKDPEKEIKKVTMIISPPFGEDDWEDKGKEKRLEFNIVPYEE